MEARWLELVQESDTVDIVAFSAEDGGIQATLNMYRNVLVTHVPVSQDTFYSGTPAIIQVVV